MKFLPLWLVVLLGIGLSACSSTRYASTTEIDDVYYSSSDETEPLQTTSYGDRDRQDNHSYDYSSRYSERREPVDSYAEAYYDDDDFHYSRRLRRFDQANAGNWRYYDPYFSNDLYFVMGTPAWNRWNNRGWYSWNRPRFGAPFNPYDPFAANYSMWYRPGLYGAYNTWGNYYSNPWVNTYYGFGPTGFYDPFRGPGLGGFNNPYCPPGFYQRGNGGVAFSVPSGSSATTRTATATRSRRPTTRTASTQRDLRPRANSANARSDEESNSRTSSRENAYLHPRARSTKVRTRTNENGTRVNRRNSTTRPSSGTRNSRYSPTNRRNNSNVRQRTSPTNRRNNSNVRQRTRPTNRSNNSNVRQRTRPSNRSSRPATTRPATRRNNSSARPSTRSNRSNRSGNNNVRRRKNNNNNQ